jgi:4-hydroxy-tetrahydrodipicolinate synthase
MPELDSKSFHGIYPSTICPLLPDYQIDEQGVLDHVISVSHIPGIRGVLCNGHAGENFVLTRSEKARIVELTRAAMPDSGVLVAGVNQESSLEAAKEARDAAAAGADAIMVFAPNSWALMQDGHMAIRHHEAVAEAVDLPLFVFQGSVSAGRMPYAPELLAELVKLPRVVGIKEGSWETATYEANRRLIRQVAPHVAVMASGDEHLFTSYVLGTEGSLVSLAVVIPETIVALDAAVRAGNLREAERLHGIVYPLACAIYRQAPAGYATARLKACLRLLGRLAHDSVRPPLGPLPDHEIRNLERALRAAQLL